MLKCGQTDNNHYTFGIKKDSEDTISDSEQHDTHCSECGEPIKLSMSFCPSCGKKL
jgi:rRNA maturation endonuclease Nob1